MESSPNCSVCHSELSRTCSMCLYKHISHHFPTGALPFSQTSLSHPLSLSPHSWCQLLDHQLTKGRRERESQGDQRPGGGEKMNWKHASKGVTWGGGCDRRCFKCCYNDEKLQEEGGESWTLTFSGWLAWTRPRCFYLNWPQDSGKPCRIFNQSLSAFVSVEGSPRS